MNPYRKRFGLLGMYFGWLIVGLFVTVAAAAPWLAPEVEHKNFRYPDNLPAYFRIVGSTRDAIPHPPGDIALLGTTGRQVDVYFSLVWGTRGALQFGLVVALGAALLGTLVGSLSGLVGGWLNYLLMRLTDGFLTFPIIAGVVLSITLRDVVLYNLTGGSTIFRWMPLSEFPQINPLVEKALSLQVVFILLSWMPYARLVNSLVLKLRSSEFVLAARTIGAAPGRIITRHLAPNVAAPVIVLISRDIGAVVLLQAALAFIGLTQDSTWGTLLAYGRDFIMGHGGNPLRYWWVFIPAGLVITLFGLGWSLLGDGLNEKLNPRRQVRYL